MPTQSQTLLDILVRLMPELKSLRTRSTDPKLANMLYNSIWSNEQAKLSDKEFKCPEEITKADLRRMESDGLIKLNNDKLEITDKGSQVIKQMILGNAESALEIKKASVKDYDAALANLKPSGNRGKSKKAFASSVDKEPRGDNWFIRATR